MGLLDLLILILIVGFLFGGFRLSGNESSAGIGGALYILVVLLVVVFVLRLVGAL